MARIDSGVCSPDESRLSQFKSTLCQLNNCGFIEAQWFANQIHTDLHVYNEGDERKGWPSLPFVPFPSCDII